MSPQPFVEQPPYDPGEHLDYCTECASFHWRGLGHACQPRPRMSWIGPLTGLALSTGIVALALLAAGALHWTPW